MLALLAFLQYRWLGQISVAERLTMQTYLRNQTRALQEEMSVEIEHATSPLSVNLDELRRDSWAGLIERYDHWKSTTRYPGLIMNVDIARVDADNRFSLATMNDSTKQFDSMEWPANLEDIRRRFEPTRRTYVDETERQAKERREEVNRVGSMIEHGYIAEEIPAIVRFAVDLKHVAEPRNPEAREPVKAEMTELLHQSPVVIIILDQDYMKQVFIPDLFRRRFTADGSLDYEVAVVYRNPREVRTERSGFELSDVTSGDATAPVFVAGVNGAETNRRPRWQIVINHKAGSLDAAVAKGRTRNLLASFGILSLLAVSVVIVIVFSRRAQKLARKQMDFIAGVSHEFRTPLAVIHAISENLADGLITDQQQIEQCGVVIRDDTRRLAGMVEQVLEFAGASRGKNLYQPQPIGVQQIIEQALAANPILETQEDWQIEKQIERDVPPVLADPAALASALRNVIDNAVKYGGDRRWIGIRANTKPNGQGGTVEITVSDRGIGIPESDLPHIFEPFYRGREVVAAQVHGNGLGLSLVKNIVEAHGGTIAVTSVPGQGSSFSLTLPAANGEVPVNDRPEAARL